jgi:Protein of unknown function (DUF3443)/Bacterial Ig-like domain (group 2)
MRHYLRRSAWLACALILTACGGSNGGASGPTLTAIAATPLTIPLAVGGTQALTVTGTYSNGTTATLGSGVTFASDNVAVATVSTAGLVTAVADGTAHITVTDAAASLSATPVTVNVTAAASTANTLAVVVDGGPAALQDANPPQPDVNVLFATVTICTPGSTSACQSIDHVQVDTGSVGLGIMSSVLTGVAVPQPITVSGGPLAECIPYADGYTWSSMAYVDVQIGGRTIASLPVNIIGDPAAGSPPASCTSGYTSSQNESSVLAFGANGVIGVGYFLQDCGIACTTDPAPTQAYYACPTSGCVPTAVPLSQQQNNPVGALAADNNGIVIVLPAVTQSGQTSVSGTLYFGVGTQANNALGSAQLLTVPDSGSAAGTLTTTFNGSTLTGSIIDAGSSAYFFNDSAIPTCSDDTSFFCPVTSAGAPTTLSLSATIQGENGVSSPQVFAIGNADSLFSSATILTALPTLGGPNGALNGIVPGFDWGLPFFYGNSVYVLFETFSVNGTTGPAVGF